MKIIEVKKNVNDAAQIRYVIADDNGKIVDDAQGYGYISKKKATKAMWWKFKNGKPIYDAKVKWWKKHKELWKSIQKDLEYWWKEICIGEFTNDDIDDMCKRKAKEMNIDLSDEMLKFAFSKIGSKMLDKAIS